MGSIALVGSAIFRDVFIWSAPLTMDQPRQRVPNGSCHKQREQRALCHPVGYGLLALANVPLCLRVLFSCLSGVALASAVHISGCFGGTPGDIVERLPHLIENMLNWGLFRSALLVIRR
jgi:hypothetical protein